LTHPATGDGQINSVTVRWLVGSGTCSNAFKIKFIHPNATGTGFTAIERGPFSSTRGNIIVPMSPPVSVASGDLIGITVLQQVSNCGGLMFTPADSSQRYWKTSRDISATDDFSNGTSGYGLQLNAFGESSSDVVAAIIPAAGATQGVGAFFRTAMQLTNPDQFSAITGRLVYHAQGHQGASNDPSLQYTLAPGTTASYTDVITQMGLSGLGSMDVITTTGPLPVITTRVFSDNGPAGTLGFTEDSVLPEQALTLGQFGYLSLPSDVTNFRMNIGVRTLGDGATINVTYYDAGGHVVATLAAKTYAANYFEQITAPQFLGTSSLVGNGSIQVYVTAGSAIVYASTTDNRTSDSAIKIAGR
jgi:tryptophan-rich sensory protein